MITSFFAPKKTSESKKRPREASAGAAAPRKNVTKNSASAAVITPSSSSIASSSNDDPATAQLTAHLHPSDWNSQLSRALASQKFRLVLCRHHLMHIAHLDHWLLWPDSNRCGLVSFLSLHQKVREGTKELGVTRSFTDKWQIMTNAKALSTKKWDAACCYNKHPPTHDPLYQHKHWPCLL